MRDNVHKPKHYCFSKFEPKDVIREWGLNFNLGSAVKYIARAGRKDDIIQDLKKAREFLTFEIDALEAERKDKPRHEDTACKCIPPEIKIADLLTMSVEDLKRIYGFGGSLKVPKTFLDNKGIKWTCTHIDINDYGYFSTGISSIVLKLQRPEEPFNTIAIKIGEGKA